MTTIERILQAAVDRSAEIKQLLTRAEEIAPTLVARQAETEARGYYAEDTHEAFKAAGFYRALVPPEFGGLGVDLETFGRIVMAIARGCPGSAWQLCLGASHTINVCQLFDTSLWPEIFADSNFIAPLPARPSGEIRQLDNGDWSLTGTYSYSSGLPYASHLISQAMPVYRDGSKGPPIVFLARRSDWTMLDDWHDAFGMKGSGSFSARFDDARIPDRFVLRAGLLDFQPKPLEKDKPSLRSNPAYYGAFEGFFLYELAALGVGAVTGALDEYANLIRTKPTIWPPISQRLENDDYLRWYGRALGRLAMAEAALTNLAQQWTESGRRRMLGEPPVSEAENLRMMLLGGEVIDIVWEIMQTLWTTMGTSPAQNGQRMQRVFRDVAMLRNHGVAADFDNRARQLAAQVLGKPAA
jgi:3-hydroxy-9,10-secoandrosta-1,3,5(10)-triene-9,17-dione monooxygenase